MFKFKKRNVYMYKTFLLTLVLTCSFVMVPQPKAKAFVDPVTAAIVAPIAINAAKAALPYVLKGLARAGGKLIKAGIEVLHIFRLPLGLLQVTLGAPWFFSDGIYNIIRGGLAPFKLTWHIIEVPLSIVGVMF